MGGFSTAVPGPITQGYNINPPAVDPYANLRALAMQGQIAEQKQNIATQQQAMGTTALNQQILQQQLDDQKALVQTFKDGVDPNKPDDIINGIIKNGGSGPTAIKFVQEIANTRKINADTDIATLSAQKTREDQFRGTVEGITKLPPEQQQAAWNEHRQEILAVDPGAPALYPGNDLAMARANTHGLQSQLIEEEQKRRETEKNVAQTTQAAAQTEKLKLINQRLKQGAHVVQPSEPHPIDGIFPASLDAAQNQYFKAAYDTGAQFVNPTTGISEVQQDVIKRATDAASKIREAQNPQIIAGEAKKAAAKVAAETGPKVAQELSIAQATDPIKLNQARAVAGATAGQREALSLDQQYAKTASATEALGKVLDAADTGNKAAGSALPVLSAEGMNAIFGIKRINKFDIDQAGGLQAGNLWDRVVGWADKAVIGQPIPQNIRDDIRSLHQMLGENGYNQYTTSLNALSQRTGVNYQPTIQAPNIRKAAATVRMKAPDGTIKPVPADQVEHFKSKGATVVQ